jgi:hypothetical protein
MLSRAIHQSEKKHWSLPDPGRSPALSGESRIA